MSTQQLGLLPMPRAHDVDVILADNDVVLGAHRALAIRRIVPRFVSLDAIEREAMVLRCLQERPAHHAGYGHALLLLHKDERAVYPASQAQAALCDA
eukprot:6206355-Pleurochrysis_carterae.AAC.3